MFEVVGPLCDGGSCVVEVVSGEVVVVVGGPGADWAAEQQVTRRSQFPQRPVVQYKLYTIIEHT